MNLLNLIEDINLADPEFQDRISPRRAAIKNITSFGSKVAVAALPFAFSTLFKKAYGQTATSSVTDVLNFALTAEYLESAYYNKYTTKSYIPAKDLPGLQIITVDENNHVKFLKSQLGSAAITSPTFDFSGGSGSGNGPFASVETSYDTFLALAQAFEDNGVRAYKGQAGNLLGNQVVLTAALNIHSVEARHASHLRYIRQTRGIGIKPWITGTNSGITVAAAAPVYAGEDNVTQGGVNLTTLPASIGTTPVSVATESFDEPLDKPSVQAILSLFIKP